MTHSEVQSLLREAATGVLTTLGADGWPHSTAMWFVPQEDAVLMWTYAKSQKAVNLRRDSRCAFLVETGAGYSELRGVLIRARVQAIEDFDSIRAIGLDLYARYTEPRTGVPVGDGTLQEIERQARKRIGIRVPFDRLASWDHGKL